MARDWCFTCFNTELKLDFQEDKIRYICYGVEKCPTTDREHYQGFAIFARTCRVPRAKEWIGGGDGTHLESRRGTRDQARDYCRKSDGEFVEWGTYEALTQRDILDLPIREIVEEYPLMYCRYYRAICDRMDKGPKSRENKVTWFYGKPGCGKTHKVMMMNDVFKIDPPYKWFNGYSGESILLIDDISDGEVPRGFLLNLLDKWRLRLETKGGHTYAAWTQTYVTSNSNPRTWDSWDRALERRCDVVTDLGNTIPDPKGWAEIVIT